MRKKEKKNGENTEKSTAKVSQSKFGQPKNNSKYIYVYYEQ